MGKAQNALIAFGILLILMWAELVLYAETLGETANVLAVLLTFVTVFFFTASFIFRARRRALRELGEEV